MLVGPRPRRAFGRPSAGGRRAPARHRRHRRARSRPSPTSFRQDPGTGRRRPRARSRPSSCRRDGQTSGARSGQRAGRRGARPGGTKARLPRCRSTRTVRSPGRSELSATAGGHLDFATSVSHHALSLDRTRARAPNSGKSKIRSHPSPFSMLCMYSYLICFIPRSPFASCGERGVLVPVPSNQPGHPHDCSATFQAALRARREIINRFVCMGWSMFIAA